MEKGKLIVSTKSNATARKTMMLISAGIMFAVGIFLIVAFDISKGINRDWGPILFVVAIVMSFGYGAFEIFIALTSSKSYCEVYEGGIVGRTGMSISDPKAPMQDVTLPFDEITNVTQLGKTLIVYTKYAKFEFLALQNCAEAVRAIQERIK